MQVGSTVLGKRATAKAAGIAFAITYLIASLCGADGMTCLLRATVTAAATLILAFFLARPVIDVVLDALARDEARRQAEQQKEEA